MSAVEGWEAPAAPIWGELRFGGELARLLAGGTLSRELLMRRRLTESRRPVLLIPGFMAGDSSLALMRGWLRARGHPVCMSGLRLNAGCADQIVSRLQEQLSGFAERCEEQVVLVGQSRGGALARSLAVREPESVSALVMLGSPVCDPLAVAPQVLRTVRFMARLGDIGVPRLFSSGCAAEGECCESFWAELDAPLEDHIEAVSVFSRSDAIVDWQACLDPYARHVEVSSSHCGMSVHPDVYRMLDELLAAEREPAWNG
ncbi:MAG TPA: alpha/beta hydrolase [Solirubrobacteraceae bacterium]|jgi:triacylglycerol lipase|nr:alpha/beta hydrolase [Solirubrobacteraceae bacterium]